MSSKTSVATCVDRGLWLCLALLMLAVGCDKKAAQTQPAECTPSCESGCGVPDGCGGQCACPAGQACTNNQCVASDCTPACTDNACRADGCGGTCPCPPGYVMDGTGNYVPREECHDTCASMGFTCGTVCGETCGACAEGQACDHGKCECKPSCDGKTCSDGCGGLCECAAGTVCDADNRCMEPESCDDTCESTGHVCGDVCGKSCGTCANGESCANGACRAALNCTDCSLKFSLAEKSVEGGQLRQVVLALDYEPSENEPRPRLADLRIIADRDVELIEVSEGESLTSAGKKLFFDETTKRNWQHRPDGSFQLFAYGVSDVDTLQPGRIATLTFTLNELGPVKFSLVRRAQMFAPPGADDALQSTEYDQAVMVSR